MGFPPVPPIVKSIAHVLKVADEHEARNIVVSYWGETKGHRAFFVIFNRTF
jgi:hypothetical protein